MAWSSFAHLPTKEEEYWHILSNLKDGMSVKDVDCIIAAYKGKEKVTHHYRGNLAKLGLFEIAENHIMLNYDEKKLLKNKKLLKKILAKSIKENPSFEINEVARAVLETHSYKLNTIAGVLKAKNPFVDHNSLIRWIRPVVVLLNIVDILSLEPDRINLYAKYLQEAYLKVEKEFGHSVPLELVEKELKKADDTLHVTLLLDSLLENIDLRFKIELLMMPSWATKNKSYKIGQDLYTHIKIKYNLLEEGNET